MDRDEKVFEHYHAAADAGLRVENTLDNLRTMLTGLYTSGAGDGLMTWREEDRDLFLGMLLDAGEGRRFQPVPSPWPTERDENKEIAYNMLNYAKQFDKTHPELAEKFREIARDLGNGV